MWVWDVPFLSSHFSINSHPRPLFFLFFLVYPCIEETSLPVETCKGLSRDLPRKDNISTCLAMVKINIKVIGKRVVYEKNGCSLETMRSIIK
jgi:hypothetical protein